MQQAEQLSRCLAHEEVTISALLVATATQPPRPCGPEPSRAVAQNREGRRDQAGHTIKNSLNNKRVKCVIRKEGIKTRQWQSHQALCHSAYYWMEGLKQRGLSLNVDYPDTVCQNAVPRSVELALILKQTGWKQRSNYQMELCFSLQDGHDNKLSSYASKKDLQRKQEFMKQYVLIGTNSYFKIHFH